MYNGRRFYRELATAVCFVSNAGISRTIRKRKKQFFIETWHGDRPIKKVLYDIDSFARNSSIWDDQVADLCIAGSDAGVRQYRSAFRYQGKILDCGTPRNDILLHCSEDMKEAIKGRIGIENRKRVLPDPWFGSGSGTYRRHIYDQGIHHAGRRG